MRRWFFKFFLPVTLFKSLDAAYRKPPVVLYIFPEAGDDFERASVLLFITGGRFTVGYFKVFLFWLLNIIYFKST
jgi:hypothetical protein